MWKNTEYLYRRHKLFISHNSESINFAKKVQTLLERSWKEGSNFIHHNVSCYVADIEIGHQNYIEDILHHLKHMDAFIFFSNEHSNKSSSCNQEIGYALAREVPILCGKWGNSIPPAFIHTNQAFKIINAEDTVDKIKSFFRQTYTY